MPTVTGKPSAHMHLRARAEKHLEAGTSPATTSWSMGVEALELLHRLSSNPDSAGDALKLLHELQVHQVELDLQNEEIASHEQSQAEQLELYRCLYESAPIGYLTIDRQYTVVRCNRSAERLLGTGNGELVGKHIHTALSLEGSRILRAFLLQITSRRGSGTCVAEADAETTGSRRLQFLAFGSPEDELVHLACCELTGSS